MFVNVLLLMFISLATLVVQFVVLKKIKKKLRVDVDVKKMLNLMDYPYCVKIKDSYYTFYDMLTQVKIGAVQMNGRNLEYEFDDIDFKKNDFVVDIGAHIGLVSVSLANKYKDINIIAIEPTLRTFNNLQKNIAINNVKNITPLNNAVGKVSGEFIDLFVPYGATMCANLSSIDFNEEIVKTQYESCKYSFQKIETISLDDIINKYCHDKTLKLLKIDCEGAEFDILYHSTKLNKIDHIRGELHGNKKDVIALFDFLCTKIKKTVIFDTVCFDLKNKKELGTLIKNCNE